MAKKIVAITNTLILVFIILFCCYSDLKRLDSTVPSLQHIKDCNYSFYHGVLSTEVLQMQTRSIGTDETYFLEFKMEKEVSNIELSELENKKVNTKKQKQLTCVENFKSYVLEYCREGSLHGLKYLGQNRKFVEKIWWAISMVVSLVCCTKLVLSAYDKWQNTPVIVSFATRDTPNWQIPFPAVTICPEIKSVPSKFNYSYYLEKKMRGETLSQLEESRFGYVTLACRQDNKLNYTNKLEYDGIKEDIFSFLDTVQPDFFKTISKCKYMGYVQNCTEIFTPLITDEGICYSFNILDRDQVFKDTVSHYKDFHKTQKSNWSIVRGYSRNDEAMTYPRRALYAGAIFSLEGVLTVKDEDLDYSCGSSIQGFKIEISDPGRIPRVRQQHFRVPLDQVVVAAITPEITTTADAIRWYSPKKRNCYLPDEKKLRYFKSYTQMDCQIECKTNYTLNKCGCIDFYMPSEKI